MRGGNPGITPFLDPAPDNNFFGTGVDLNLRRLVRGELAQPSGGAGGGGGGDRSVSCDPNDPGFINDNKGGGGGAGGGVLVIAANGMVQVGPQGWISADGGNGGGGEQAGANNQGAGGAGGSGGLLVILTRTGIELVAHGETYANNDYSFSVSADGGVGTQGRFSGTEILGKYPPLSSTSAWNQKPIGGMGGMGIVELVVPIGNNSDGTNTIFDDNVHILDANGNRLTGAQKQRYIAWRGYFDPVQGRFEDDFGNPTNIGDNEGDIRPSPVLLPLLR